MSDKQLIVQCGCHQGHFVNVVYHEPFAGDAASAYFILAGDFVTTQLGLWDRITGAFAVLFGGHWNWAEVTLDGQKAQQIAAFLAGLDLPPEGADDA